MSKEIEELAEIIKNNSNKWLQDKFALELNTKPFEFLAKAILDAGYTKSPIDTEKLTVISDAELEKDIQKDYSDFRIKTEEARMADILYWTRENQLAHTKQEIKKQMEGK